MSEGEIVGIVYAVIGVLVLTGIAFFCSREPTAKPTPPVDMGTCGTCGTRADLAEYFDGSVD